MTAIKFANIEKSFLDLKFTILMLNGTSEGSLHLGSPDAARTVYMFKYNIFAQNYFHASREDLFSFQRLKLRTALAICNLGKKWRERVLRQLKLDEMARKNG